MKEKVKSKMSLRSGGIRDGGVTERGSGAEGGGKLPKLLALTDDDVEGLEVRLRETAGKLRACKMEASKGEEGSRGGDRGAGASGTTNLSTEVEVIHW